MLLVVLGAGGCRSPAHQVEAFAAAHGFEREVVQGRPFRHVVLRNRLPARHSILRVYIEGDGTPFLNASTVAVDPTPLQPLMLHLMALDPQGAVYVGRPCYLGLREDKPCEPLDWTLRRFSPAIVASMAVVIDSEMRGAGATSVQLFGHSGGAALAVLLAPELPVEALVTIGGNLDIDAWVQLHGYTPLRGSLNPAAVELSPALALRTDHFVGANDTSVPASLVRTASARIGGTVHEIPGYSHQCCWEEQWPSILSSESRY
jgi:pimeloyl-ACP methyl ester carboxylesterase